MWFFSLLTPKWLYSPLKYEPYGPRLPLGFYHWRPERLPRPATQGRFAGVGLDLGLVFVILTEVDVLDLVSSSLLDSVLTRLDLGWTRSGSWSLSSRSRSESLKVSSLSESIRISLRTWFLVNFFVVLAKQTLTEWKQNSTNHKTGSLFHWSQFTLNLDGIKLWFTASDNTRLWSYPHSGSQTRILVSGPIRTKVLKREYSSPVTYELKKPC